MIDQAKLDGAPTGAAAPGVELPIEKMDVGALLALRARISAALPATKLADLNLEEEIVVQYMTVKDLLNTVLKDKETPANQKAQIANSCESVLESLMKRQASMYGTERVKAMERALIRALKAIPEAARLQFFEDYQRFYTAEPEAVPSA